VELRVNGKLVGSLQWRNIGRMPTRRKFGEWCWYEYEFWKTDEAGETTSSSGTVSHDRETGLVALVSTALMDATGQHQTFSPWAKEKPKERSPDDLLTEKEVASHLGVKPNTLASWRVTGLQPLPYTKVGNRVRYRWGDVLAYLEGNRREHT
jgi:hypothetical protein